VVEAALEPAPGDGVCMICAVAQEVPNVVVAGAGTRAAHTDIGFARGSARIECGTRIADNGSASAAAREHADAAPTHLTGVAGRLGSEVGIAGDQVQRADRGRPEGGAEGIVAHGEMLRIVPERGDGVAVEVSHYHVLCFTADNEVAKRRDRTQTIELADFFR